MSPGENLGELGARRAVGTGLDKVAGLGGGNVRVRLEPGAPGRIRTCAPGSGGRHRITLPIRDESPGQRPAQAL